MLDAQKYNFLTTFDLTVNNPVRYLIPDALSSY